MGLGSAEWKGVSSTLVASFFPLHLEALGLKVKTGVKVLGLETGSDGLTGVKIEAEGQEDTVGRVLALSNMRSPNMKEGPRIPPKWMSSNF